jgi:hypothetical protein
MKKTILIAAAIVSITVACKSKKAVSNTASTGVTTEAQLTAVKARFPDATKEELEKGHSVYTGACTKCHGTKDVTVYTEPRLLEIVDVMAKKSKLTPEDKQALIRFAVGVRATNPSK